MQVNDKPKYWNQGKVNINPGTHTIYQGSLIDARNDISDRSNDFSADGIAAGLDAASDRQFQSEKDKNMVKFLQVLSMMNAGRGVNKALQTPAQLNGLNPQNPQMFNMQPKQAIPYQKVLNDKRNLAAVLKSYQEVTNDNGPFDLDTANIIANVRRSESIIGEAFNKQKAESIFAGTPKQKAQNLYNIALKNQREHSIYALN